MIRKLSATVVLFLSLTYISCKKESTTPQPAPPTDTTVIVPPVVVVPPVAEVFYDNDNMLLGNPSNATDSLDDDNYLMRKDAYSLSYNRYRGIPNWVSWHLNSADLGSVSRSDNFLPDGNLPSSWYAVTSASYSGSGFDRGHNCPSGDRTSTTTLNDYTFLMTNIIPQAPTLNQGIWADLENYTRDLVTQGNEAYIIMGNYGSGGTGTNGYFTTIDNGNVAVPQTIWKVVVIIPNGNNDTSRIDANTRVIAVQMPNTNAVVNNWKSYRTTVDMIEDATGLDLLSRLPVNIQAVLEAKVDNQ